MDDNPFQIGGPVAGAAFTDRADEVAGIRRCLLEGGRVLVHGPRRMGKSSAIRVAGEAVERGGGFVVRADLSTVTTYLDISSRLLRTLYEATRSLGLPHEEVFEGVAPRVTVTSDPSGGAPAISFGVERRTATESAQRRSLESVIERLATVAARWSIPVGVVLDEFEALGGLGGESAEWHLRDLVQRHGELAFVFAGSREPLIREMIGLKGAFYKMFEEVHVGPIERTHLELWIEDRLRTAGRVGRGVAGALLDRVGDRTQDAVQVARQLWLRGRGLARPLTVADVGPAFDDVVRHEAPVIHTLWNELSAHQQDVLRVVALGARQLFSSGTRDRYGLPAASSVQRAVAALIGRGLLVRTEDEIAFDSPFVGAWVRREVAPDLGGS